MQWNGKDFFDPEKQLESLERYRVLEVARELLAGLCANPGAIQGRDWEATEVKRAVRMARALIEEVYGGN